jgi:hypothetical protein
MRLCPFQEGSMRDNIIDQGMLTAETQVVFASKG